MLGISPGLNIKFFDSEIEWCGFQREHPTGLIEQAFGAAQLKLGKYGCQESGHHVINHLVPHA